MLTKTFPDRCQGTTFNCFQLFFEDEFFDSVFFKVPENWRTNAFFKGNSKQTRCAEKLLENCVLAFTRFLHLHRTQNTSTSFANPPTWSAPGEHVMIPRHSVQKRAILKGFLNELRHSSFELRQWDPTGSGRTLTCITHFNGFEQNWFPFENDQVECGELWWNF